MSSKNKIWREQMPDISKRIAVVSVSKRHTWAWFPVPVSTRHTNNWIMWWWLMCTDFVAVLCLETRTHVCDWGGIPVRHPSSNIAEALSLVFSGKVWMSVVPSQIQTARMFRRRKGGSLLPLRNDPVSNRGKRNNYACLRDVWVLVEQFFSFSCAECDDK